MFKYKLGDEVQIVDDDCYPNNNGLKGVIFEFEVDYEYPYHLKITSPHHEDQEVWCKDGEIERINNRKIYKYKGEEYV